jgi:nitroreductase
MEMLKDLVLKCRSYRRFDESVAIERETLEELVDLARCTASAVNRQPLRYILSLEPEKNAKIFRHLGWAAALKDWPGPAEGERPAAYIIILGDKRLTDNFWCDHGIAAQTILLGAVEKGLGGCMLGSVNKPALTKDLGIADYYEIMLVIALGKPGETVVLEEMEADGSFTYWRDEKSVHHVPKRKLKDVIVG